MIFLCLAVGFLGVFSAFDDRFTNDCDFDFGVESI
jgi:hypothetical protein